MRVQVGEWLREASGKVEPELATFRRIPGGIVGRPSGGSGQPVAEKGICDARESVETQEELN